MPNEVVPQGEGGGEVVENTVDIETIPGEERAAILLLSLNEEDAAGIIRHLEPKQVQRVGSAMARAADLSQEKSVQYTVLSGRHSEIHQYRYGQ